MGSVEGCHTWHGLRRVRDLPNISVQRYLPVLGPTRAPSLGACTTSGVGTITDPHGVRSAKFAQNTVVAKGLGSRINGA